MFLRTLGQMAGRTGIRVRADALMDNHYHPVLVTPKSNPVAGMQCKRFEWMETAPGFDAAGPLLRSTVSVVGRAGDRNSPPACRRPGWTGTAPPQ